MKKRSVLMTVLAMILVAVISVGSTLAYLTATDKKVVNTFTFGDMTVKLEEPTPSVPPEVTTTPNDDGGYDYENVTPNSVLGKNPQVSTETDVNSYLFIKVSGANDMIKPCLVEKDENGQVVKTDGQIVTKEGNPITTEFGWTDAGSTKDGYTVDAYYNGLYYREIKVGVDGDTKTEPNDGKNKYGAFNVFQYVKVADKDIVITLDKNGNAVTNEIAADGTLKPVTINLPSIKVEVFEIQAEGLDVTAARTEAEDFFAKNVVIPTPTPAGNTEGGTT